MAEYVVFIRGVAPSTPPRNNACIVPALQRHFPQVTSVLSSGNYLVEAEASSPEAVETAVEAALQDELDTSLTTIARSVKQVRHILDHNPLAGIPHGPGNYQLITFFKHPVTIDVPLPYQPEGKFFQVAGMVDGALFTLTDNTQVRTLKVMDWLERHFTSQLTSRTPLTLGKILRQAQGI